MSKISNVKGVKTSIHAAKWMPDAVLFQNNPVSGQLYSVLPTTRDCIIRSVAVRVTWTVQPTPLELVLVIDGVTFTHAFANPASTTYYYLYHSPANPADNQLLTINVTEANYIVPWGEGKSVQISARTTGGTVSVLQARCKYSVR